MSLSSYDNSLLLAIHHWPPPTCRYPSCHLDCVERLKVNWTILTIPVPSSFVQISKTRACGEQGRADRTPPLPSATPPPDTRTGHLPPSSLPPSLPPALHHNLKMSPAWHGAYSHSLLSLGRWVGLKLKYRDAVHWPLSRIYTIDCRPKGLVSAMSITWRSINRGHIWFMPQLTQLLKRGRGSI